LQSVQNKKTQYQKPKRMVEYGCAILRGGDKFSLLVFTMPAFAITLLHIDVDEDVVKECLGEQKCKVIVAKKSSFNWLIHNGPNAQIVLQGQTSQNFPVTKLEDLLTMCNDVFNFHANNERTRPKTEEWDNWINWDCELISNK
jgi:hypothetical protein